MNTENCETEQNLFAFGTFVWRRLVMIKKTENKIRRKLSVALSFVCLLKILT